MTKTASAVAPATDDTALAMFYQSGVAYPLMIVLNSTAAGGTGVRSSLFNPSTGTFTNGFVATVDSLGASWATRLSAANDTSGNIVIAYYDITQTRVKYNSTSTGVSWLGGSPMISALAKGQWGLKVALNPYTTRPGVSYYDRTNNVAYYTYCSASSLNACSSSVNWTTTTINSTLGISGFATATDQLLNSSLTYSTTGNAYITYLTGVGATNQQLRVADDTTGTFADNATLATNPLANISGATTPNFAMVGLSESSVRTATGTFFSAHIGWNNWLYAATCGD